jgi:cysteine-rich repeat protein
MMFVPGRALVYPPTCGNNVLEAGEQCDDGNTMSGDGCSATCTVESGWSCSGQPSVCAPVCGDGITVGTEECDLGPANGAPDACCDVDCTLRSAAYTCRPASGPCDVAESCTGSDPACPPDRFATDGAPCTDDTNLCTADICDGVGTCTHPYEPDPNCTTPAAHGATLRIISHPGVAVADEVQFKWSKGPAVPLTAFGSPRGGTAYAFCVYDGTPSGPVPTYQGQPGGQCQVEPCWSSAPMGWTFTSKSGVPDGIISITLKEGLMPGMAKVQAKAKGLLTLESLPLQMSPNVTAQVRTGEGNCWGATFSTAMRNASGMFMGRSD